MGIFLKHRTVHFEEVNFRICDLYLKLCERDRKKGRKEGGKEERKKERERGRKEGNKKNKRQPKRKMKPRRNRECREQKKISQNVIKPQKAKKRYYSHKIRREWHFNKKRFLEIKVLYLKF